MKRRVEIISRQDIFKRFIFRIEEAVLRHEKFNGEMSEALTRLNFNRGDSVAILMHEPQADTIILTEQFRFPTYKPEDPKSNGWILEIPAGSMDKDETPEECVRREVKEEIGFDIEITAMEHISTFYLSPGGTSERIILYYTRLTPYQKREGGGGVISEGEDIRTMAVKVGDALNMIQTGELTDAKSIIGLQWMQLRKLAQKPV